MTETKANATEGTCLFCDETKSATPAGVLQAHRYGDGSECPGSGQRPARNDGKDQVRRHAITRYNAVRDQVAHRRSELRDDLAKGWTTADLFEYHGTAVIRVETVAARWAELGAHGDWWIAFDVAIRGCVPAWPSTPMDQVIAHERAQGNRLWLADARVELAKESAKLDPTARDIIDNLLYRM